MILWTIQSLSAFVELFDSGLLVGQKQFVDAQFLYAYNYMAGQMQERGLHRNCSTHYPIWAWHTWEGVRDKRNTHDCGLLPQGEWGVQLTIDVPCNQVLLSDFDLWHNVLNNSPIFQNEQDLENFDLNFLNEQDLENFDLATQAPKQFDSSFLNEQDLENFDAATQTPKQFDSSILNVQDFENFDLATHTPKNFNWHLIFALNTQDSFFQLAPHQRTIQACFWQLNISQVKDIEFFKAR